MKFFGGYALQRIRFIDGHNDAKYYQIRSCLRTYLLGHRPI